MDALLKLQQLADESQLSDIYSLFKSNPKRYVEMSVSANGIIFDFSKQRLNATILSNLLCLAEQSGLSARIDDLFSNVCINNTENRSAAHWALRMPQLGTTDTEYSETNQLVHDQLDKMQGIVNGLRSGKMRGATGDRITDVVNVGVGGSNLGPLMAHGALNKTGDQCGIEVHFVSTMDGSQLHHLLDKLRPQTTLFIISSKSFTTMDTLSNAMVARSWITRLLGDDSSVLSHHFIGVSSNPDKMTQWGISPELQLSLWDWVGGRYSIWSTIGLPVAIAIGMDEFRKLLMGGHDADRHFLTAGWESNIPVLLALIGVWNNNFLKINNHAILPYDGRLKDLTSYLQQLEMESNGKSIRKDGSPVTHDTCPVIWGGVGPDSQHAFYQLLHQGTVTSSIDFIITRRRGNGEDLSDELQYQHQLTIANCLSQSRLLAFGNHATYHDESNTLSHMQYSGNKPNSTIVIPQLDPYYLGMLIATFEHKVFVQSIIWDINPFDQWGVEAGKVIVQEILPYLTNCDTGPDLDGSTVGLLQELRFDPKS